MSHASSAVQTKPISTTLDDERLLPDSPDRATFQHHLARYQFALRWLRPHFSVLETGCGTGYGTQLIAAHVSFVLGMDYSSEAVAYAREHFSAPNLHYAVMDCRRFAVPEGRFDCVVSFEVLEHLSDQAAYLADCRRALRAGGLLLLSTPNRITADIHMDSVGQENRFHIGMLSLEELRRLLSRNFCRFEMYGQRRRGSRLYETLRALDPWNLRLRLLSNGRRERMQAALGVPVGHAAAVEDWVIARSQLRQANNFLAVCWKED